MDFVLSDDQHVLRDELRRFLTARLPTPASGPGANGVVDRALWAELGGLGVFDVTSSGLGWAGAVIVFEELGRAAAPGPLIPTTLAATLVDGAAEGSTVVGFAQPESPSVVEHLEDLDVLLVERGERIEVAEPPNGTVVREPLDPLTPVWLVDELPAGDDAGGRTPFLAAAGLLAAAFQVGLGQAAVDLGVGHARQRQQFGRTIGAFQAVKHLLADAAVSIEVARAAVHAAAVARDEDEPWARPACAARVVAARAADEAARACIQVHGGMGFTWELPAHLFLKRSWVLDASFGGLDATVSELSEHLAIP